MCGQSCLTAIDHDTVWSSRTWPIQPITRPNGTPAMNSVWQTHMIGDSRMKNIVSVATLARKRAVPPKARRSGGRVSTSSTVAILGANHMTRIMASSA